MKKLIIIVAPIVIIYLGLRYFATGLDENERGVSNGPSDAMDRKTFVAKYRIIGNVSLDSILGNNICKEVWLEKTWTYKKWHFFEISDRYYTFIMEIQRESGSSMDVFNAKWSIYLSGTDKYDESALNYTRHREKYVLITTLRQGLPLDTLTFDVKMEGSDRNFEPLQFIRENTK